MDVAICPFVEAIFCGRDECVDEDPVDRVDTRLHFRGLMVLCVLVVELALLLLLLLPALVIVIFGMIGSICYQLQYVNVPCVLVQYLYGRPS